MPVIKQIFNNCSYTLFNYIYEVLSNVSCILFISTLLCTLLVPLVINGVSYFVIFSKESKKQSQSNHNEEVEYFP